MPVEAPSKPRTVDPVLSRHARQYQHPARVGGLLFPRVRVETRTGTIVEFEQDDFLSQSGRRQVGEASGQAGPGSPGADYTLLRDSLPTRKLPDLGTDADEGERAELGKRAVDGAMFSLSLTLEWEQARIATDPANYSDGHKWRPRRDVRWNSTDSAPLDDIAGARQTIRDACGHYPNVMVAGRQGMNTLTRHPEIAACIEGADRPRVEVLQNLFQIGKVAEASATVARDGGFEDVWWDDVVLAYVPEAPLDREEPSYGYTYAMDGHPRVAETQAGDGASSFEVILERRPVLTSPLAGFLFAGVCGISGRRG